MTDPAELLDDLRFWLQAKVDYQHSKQQSSHMLTQRVNHGAKARAFSEVRNWLDSHPASESPAPPQSHMSDRAAGWACRCGADMPAPYAGRQHPWRCGSCHRLWAAICLGTLNGYWEEVQGPRNARGTTWEYELEDIPLRDKG